MVFKTRYEDIFYSIVCKNTNIFSDLEKIFYQKYPEFNGNTVFKNNGITIKKKKSLEENGIHNNSIITIITDN